jgi:hypothetical protein
MPYADAVLKEAMRAHGIVDGIWRCALEDLQVQGRRVPKVGALFFSLFFSPMHGVGLFAPSEADFASEVGGFSLFDTSPRLLHAPTRHCPCYAS